MRNNFVSSYRVQTPALPDMRKTSVRDKPQWLRKGQSSLACATATASFPVGPSQEWLRLACDPPFSPSPSPWAPQHALPTRKARACCLSPTKNQRTTCVSLLKLNVFTILVSPTNHSFSTVSSDINIFMRQIKTIQKGSPKKKILGAVR